MTQRRIQDIHMPSNAHKSKRVQRIDASISNRDTPIAHRTKTKRSASEKKTSSGKRSSPKKKSVSRYPKVDLPRHKKHQGSRVLWWIAIIAIIAVGFSLSSVFSRAEVTLEPRRITTDIAMTLTAEKDALGSALEFDVVALAEEATKTLRSNGVEDVQEKASGKIVIYNAFSSKSQNLVEETRFQTPDGKIYKLGKGQGTVVPGMDGDTPGSVEAIVYAENPGASYNGDPTDFVIPGFSGGPKFEKFYARSVGPITGGFSGQRQQVPESLLEGARENLKDALRESLLSKVTMQKTDRMVSFDETTQIDFTETISDNADGSIALTQKAVLRAVLFDIDELSRQVAKGVLDEQEASLVRITNFEELNFSQIPSADGINFIATGLVEFSLDGPAKFEWIVDTDALQQDLYSIGKSAFQDVIDQYPGVHKARLSVRPFWRSRLPNDKEKVVIIFQ